LFVGQDEFEFDLGEEVHGVFAAAIDFRVTFLPAEAFDFGDRHAFDANFAQGVFDLFKLEGFDDGFNFLHSIVLVIVRVAGEPAWAMGDRVKIKFRRRQVWPTSPSNADATMVK
jgi:hypothetical protein